MKTLFFRLAAVAVLTFQLVCCGEPFPTRFVVELPPVPREWVSLLGEPWWRIEWIAPDGQLRKEDVPPGNRITVDLPVTWTNAVTAYPWWSEHNLIPGFFKPAGGLFPYDVSGGKLCLSWKAGPDSVFYWELSSANDGNVSKIPANFNWTRFRELFETDVLREEVVADPWLVDWRYVAERAVNSNFDRRQLVPEETEDVNIPVPTGFWYGTSPFAQPLFFAENETPVFPVRSGVNVWISSEGILRCSGRTWTFFVLP